MSNNGARTTDFFNSGDIIKEGNTGVSDKICDAANGVSPMLGAKPSSGGPSI